MQCATAEAAPPPITPGSWTLAVLPDTQVYAQSYPQHFTAQTTWIRDNAAAYNIQYVLHEGDVVNNNNVAQWDNALASLSVLDGAVPYAIAPGNHDYGPNGNAANRDSLFYSPTYFGPGTPYANQATIGGFYEAGRTDNSYHTFSAGGQDWLVLALEFGPRDDVVAWANNIVSNHPDHLAMLVTHAYMYFDETIYDWAAKGSSQNWNPHAYGVANLPGGVNDGAELWDKLVSQHDNFRLTFNGHVLGDGTGFRSTEGEAGNAVHQMLANYQFKSQGGMGDMRLLEFKSDGQTVEVRTYSPVLDRLDTAFDQQFTLNLNELHDPLTPPPPPLIKHAVAAQLVAVGATDPSANVVDAVQVVRSSMPGVSTLRLNRGDYQIAVDGQGLEYQHGVLLATITEHDRPDFLNRRASVEVGRSSYGDGLLSLSIMEAGNPGDNEVNFDVATAWFQFAAGWRGAHVDGDGSLAPGASNLVGPSQVTRVAQGRYNINLDVDSRHDGILLATANNNDNMVVQTGPLPDGSGWDVRVQDNATQFAPTGRDLPFSFIYLPYETQNFVGGYYDGIGDTHLASAGDFNIQRLGAGQYELSLAGETPDTGMLLLTVAHRVNASGVTAPDDNILTYEASQAGTFLINSYDLPGLGFQDTKFVWTFLSYDNPLTLAGLAGDYNGDGTVGGDDLLSWQRTLGDQAAPPGSGADGDESGLVDAGDLAVWQSFFGQSASSATGSIRVPEAASATLLLCLLVTRVCSSRRDR